MRKLGIYPVGGSGKALSELIQCIADTGFDHIGASIGHIIKNSELNFLSSVEKSGLEIDNLHLSGKGTSKIWLEDEFGDSVIEHYKNEIDLSVANGIKKGVIHVTWGHEEVPVSSIGVDRFSKLVEYAEKKNYIICFENSVSSEHFRKIMDSFCDSPSARFTFDTGHWNAFSPFDDFYDDYADKIEITHLADNDGSRDLHLIPLDGKADFKKLSGALGRLDKLTFELSGPLKVFKSENTIAQDRDIFSDMEIYKDGAVEFREGEFTLYNGFSLEAYLGRVMDNAKRLDALINENT